MSKLQWYWHRLRAMEPLEIAAHVRKKFCQWSDEQELPDWSSVSVRTDERPAFPSLPPADLAPLVLREALQRDVRDILGGRWRAFGHLEIKVDDPPGWQTDYLAGKNLETDELAFHLDHRRLPEGADIKLIWELSRWHQLVRLAMAAHVLGAEHAARKCIEWLGHWVRHNPPCRGWNWTSALEVGMRLVQFAWMDALLEGYLDIELKRLRAEILPAHIWFAWRYRSFGSSANNHRLGELAGLILVIARWPELARWAALLAFVFVGVLLAGAGRVDSVRPTNFTRSRGASPPRRGFLCKRSGGRRGVGLRRFGQRFCHPVFPGRKKRDR
ncbi:MAG: hypothetical protein DME22_22375 [Verrucomicrobia bacterium]|nr:MAG: hypothetical protein DME22_22375 [Verrucomicrobiota bacterium]